MMKKKYILFSIPFLLFSFGFYFLKNSDIKQKSSFQKHRAGDYEKIDGNESPHTNQEYKNYDNDFSVINNDTNKLKEFKKQQTVYAFFSPRDDIRSIIIRCIELETNEIICAAFRLTDQQITQALLDAINRGVKVVFIVDREGISALNSKLLHLIDKGIPIYYFPPLEDISSMVHKSFGLMHNKIMSFKSQEMIITGSFNFTKSAQDRNRENIIVIKNNDEIFNRYQAELKILKSESTLLQGNKIPLYFNNEKF